MANLATRAGVEGTQRLKIHTPLIELTKAEIIRRGLALGVDFALTSSCYDPVADRRTLRRLRLLPAARQGLRRSRPPRSPAHPLQGRLSMTDQLLYAAAVPFEAARQVTLLPEGHRSRRLHGHSFTAKVWAALPDGLGALPRRRSRRTARPAHQTLTPLDYQHLNQSARPAHRREPRPLDPVSRIDVPGLLKVGVLSTPHEGVDLDRNDHAHVWRRYVLQSAHRLPNVKPGHKCGRMHGHGFEIILHADQDLGAREISVDYDHLDELWAPIHAELDHACLNDIPGLENPTSEMISAWIWRTAEARAPGALLGHGLRDRELRRALRRPALPHLEGNDASTARCD